MRTKHWHVLCGLRELYMPDNNDVCTTRRGAEETARWHANNARECGDRVKGSARSGLYLVGDHNQIEITSCNERECLDHVEE